MTTAAEVWEPLVASVTERGDYEVLHHDYFMAENDLPIDTTELESKFGTTFANFRDNLARPIIETAEGRVRIEDLSEESALEVWQRNNLQLESKLLHTDAMVMGRSFVIVLPDEDDKAGIWPQQTGACGILYAEDDPRDRTVGIKHWSAQFTDEGKTKPEWRVRVNLYFEDRIERYIGTRSGRALESKFEKYEPYHDGPTAWSTKHKVGQVPMFEFRCNWDMSSQASRSDLHDAVPLIDAINKTFLDMLTASEYTAAPQRWATGVEIPLDPNTGKPLQTFKAGSDEVWTAANEAAKFGQFTPGALTAYKAAIDTLVDHLVYVSRTPKYALAGDSKYSSGENLRIIESPLRSRVTDHQDEFTTIWQQILAAALGIEGQTIDPWTILISWLPANAPFFTAERLEELKLKVEVAGIPQEQIWKEMGYSEIEIEDMKEMRDEEAALGFDEIDAVATSLLTSDAPAAQPPAGLAAES